MITEHGKMPFLHDSPLLPAIRLLHPGCPFRAIRPPALNNFRHPWLDMAIQNHEMMRGEFIWRVNCKWI